MGRFNEKYLNMFLGVVRKYMQVRGGLSQKDLAEMLDVGVSTMSRFLNQKTKDLDPQLIANIVAHLGIPLHEIIDFIEEDFTDKFKRLIQFYKDEDPENIDGNLIEDEDEPPEEAISAGTAKRPAKATVRIGKRTTTIPFEPEKNEEKPTGIREKLEALSPRQKAYISDFLGLDPEARDLVVDLGNSLIRYFRQRGIDL